MSVGQRNDELIGRNAGDLLLRREFYEDSARLLSAVLATHRDGGGMLVEGWMGDSTQAFGRATGSVWTGTNIGPEDYFATANGGPYVDLDGSSEYFYIPDATWQEAGTVSIFTWRWCRTTTLASNQTIIAKWNTASGNNRSWKLWYSAGNGFRFTTNATGAAAADVHVTSSYTAAVDAWYFVAGYWKASTLLRIFVGAATDTSLTITSNFVGVSGSVFNGTAALTMWASDGPADYWSGYGGVGHTRFNVPSTSVDAYATRLFHLTRWFYQA